jgi:5-hydroxyisourate hydrolase-like protein (transthyretin family)
MATGEVRLTKGTVENVPIKVTDVLNALITLTGADLRYDLYKADAAETAVVTNASAANDVMIALPLIDTTNLEEGYYNLYIHFVASPQQVRLGPFRIRVDD